MANPLVKEENSTDVAVVMLPFPAQGRINPLLHFSGHLVSAAHNISVYFAGTAVYLRQAAKDRVHGWDPSSTTNMHFHEFKPTHSTASSIYNIPPHLIPLMEATTPIREPVYTFVNELSTKYRKVVIIYDYLMSYLVQDIHSIKNAEAYRFHAVSACHSFCFHREAQDKVAATPPPEAAEVLKNTLSSEGLSSPESLKFRHMQENARKVFSGDIYNWWILKPLWMEFLPGEYNQWSGDSNLANERREEIVSADIVEKVVRTLMASKEGDEIRERAKEMGNRVKKSMMEDGGARKEFDLFIAQITR